MRPRLFEKREHRTSAVFGCRAAGEAAADVPETNESYAEYRGYAVKTMATQGGTIDAMVDSANRNKIAFVVKPDSNKTVKTVKASYTGLDGTAKTTVLEQAKDGSYVMVLEDTSEGQQDRNVFARLGTEISVSVEFENKSGAAAPSQAGSSAEAYVTGRKHPIMLHITGDGELTEVSKADNGYVFTSQRGESSKEGETFKVAYTSEENGALVFKEQEITPAADGRVVIPSSLMSSIKPGTVINLFAEYVADTHPVGVSGSLPEGITASVSASEAKLGDTIKVTVNVPEDKHVDKVEITYLSDKGTAKTVQVRKNEDGEYTFLMPKVKPAAEGAEANGVSVNVTTRDKAVSTSVERQMKDAGDTTAFDVNISHAHIDEGDAVSFTLSKPAGNSQGSEGGEGEGSSQEPEAIRDYEVLEVKAVATKENGDVDEAVKLLVKQNPDGSYAIERTDEHKEDGFNFKNVKFTVTVGKLPVSVTADQNLSHGTVTIQPSSEHTKAGRTITASVAGTPDGNQPYRVDQNSVQAVIKKADGTRFGVAKGQKRQRHLELPGTRQHAG